MSKFKKPDLNGPRFRKTSYQVLNKSLYENFIESNPNYDIDYETFKSIINTFNKNLYQGAIDNRSGIELPDGLGYIFLGSCDKPKKKNIDMVKGAKYGISTTYKNWDSDNRLLKIFYVGRANRLALKYKNLWAFTAVRNFKRTASKAFKEDWTKYIQVAPHVKASGFFTNTGVKKVSSENFEHVDFTIVPEGYDEFKM